MNVQSLEFDKLTTQLKRLLPNHKNYFNSLEIHYETGNEQFPHRFILSYMNGDKREQIVSTGSTDTDCKYHAEDFAKYAFLNLVANNLKYTDLAEYFYSGIKSIYRNAKLIKKTDHTIVNYTSLSININSSIFSTTLSEDTLIFLSDDIPLESFKLNSEKVGSTTTFCKHSPDAFNKYNLIGMLKLSPTFTHSTFLYTKALRIKPQKAFKLIDLLSSGESSESYILKKRLVEMPAEDGQAFEDLCEDILKFLFSNEYEHFVLRKQIPSYKGIRRRDFIIDNISPHHRFLLDMKTKGVRHILFDAKNYSKPLSTSDLDTFFSYIQEQPGFGKFGIILSRKGVNSNAKDQIVLRMVGRHGEVITLDENDLSNMIDIREMGRDPMSVIEDKLIDLQLMA